MNDISMTALMCTFLRAYHNRNKTVKIFDDPLAFPLLTSETYDQIHRSLCRDTGFFSDGKHISPEYIIDNILSPTPLGRAAFAEDALHTAVRLGAKQYIIAAAGFDTFSLRRPPYAESIRVFELDRENMIADKLSRISNAGISQSENTFRIPCDLTNSPDRALLNCTAFDHRTVSFCSMMGLSCYFTKTAFERLIDCFSQIFPVGSSLVFDYCTSPDRHISALANSAGETFLACYSLQELEQILSRCGWLIYENLTPDELANRFFSTYNTAYPTQRIIPPENVSCCLSVLR